MSLPEPGWISPAGAQVTPFPLPETYTILYREGGGPIVEEKAEGSGVFHSTGDAGLGVKVGEDADGNTVLETSIEREYTYSAILIDSVRYIYQLPRIPEEPDTKSSLWRC